MLFFVLEPAMRHGLMVASGRPAVEREPQPTRRHNNTAAAATRTRRAATATRGRTHPPFAYAGGRGALGRPRVTDQLVRVPLLTAAAGVFADLQPVVDLRTTPGVVGVVGVCCPIAFDGGTDCTCDAAEHDADSVDDR